MGYMHIDNLYKAKEILQFREYYTLEKIHGTSVHVRWQVGKLSFFSGGEKHDKFVALFAQVLLTAKFAERYPLDDIIVYGEAYSGSCQRMSKTYGPNLRFIVFNVQFNEWWQQVEQAARLVVYLGLDFVDYTKVSTDINVLNAERDKPSSQAIRNGIMDEPKLREGVVLRPPFEVILNNGRRLIAKHKSDAFSERGTPQVDLDPSKQEILDNAEAVALEWVTPRRLEHVTDHIIAEREDKNVDTQDIPVVLTAMIEAVMREGAGEFVDSKPARRAISQLTVVLFKQLLQSRLPHE